MTTCNAHQEGSEYLCPDQKPCPRHEGFIGYLFHQDGWKVCCPECHPYYPQAETKLYHVNVFPYRQDCCRCGKELVKPQTSAWCEMYPAEVESAPMSQGYEADCEQDRIDGIPDLYDLGNPIA